MTSKKILGLVLGCLLFALPAHASILFNYYKSGGEGEVFYLHPSISLCTRLKTTAGASAFMPSIRFDAMGTSDGCWVAFPGVVPSSAASSSYIMTFRLFFAVAAQTPATKVVGLGVRAYAVVPSGRTGAGPERITNSTQVTGTYNPVASTWVGDQVYSMDIDAQIKMPDGNNCNSDCDGTELVLLVQPTASMTIPGGQFYLIGYMPLWSH